MLRKEPVKIAEWVNRRFGTIVTLVATENRIVSAVIAHTCYSKLVISKLIVQKY